MSRDRVSHRADEFLSVVTRQRTTIADCGSIGLHRQRPQTATVVEMQPHCRFGYALGEREVPLPGSTENLVWTHSEVTPRMSEVRFGLYPFGSDTWSESG